MIVNFSEKEEQPTNFVTERRLGRLQAVWDIMKKCPTEIAQALSGAIIFRSDYRIDTGIVEYLAFHPEFDILPEGHIAPLYEIIFTAHYAEDGTKTVTSEIKRAAGWKDNIAWC